MDAALASPGVVAVVSRRGETRVEAIGTQSFGGTPMRRDTIFRIASMTKTITAAATLILVEECRLRLDDPVDAFLPDGSTKEEAKVIAETRRVLHLEQARARLDQARGEVDERDLGGVGGAVEHRLASEDAAHEHAVDAADEPLECVVVRSGQDPIVVNLDIEGVADPEGVPWIDATHPVA